jgi:hypothetical protein
MLTRWDLRVLARRTGVYWRSDLHGQALVAVAGTRHRISIRARLRRLVSAHHHGCRRIFRVKPAAAHGRECRHWRMKPHLMTISTLRLSSGPGSAGTAILDVGLVVADGGITRVSRHAIVGVRRSELRSSAETAMSVIASAASLNCQRQQGNRAYCLVRDDELVDVDHPAADSRNCCRGRRGAGGRGRLAMATDRSDRRARRGPSYRPSTRSESADRAGSCAVAAADPRRRRVRGRRRDIHGQELRALAADIQADRARTGDRSLHQSD